MKRLIAAVLCLFLCVSLLPGAVSAQNAEVNIPIDKEAVLAGLYEADLFTLRQAIAEGYITSEELTSYYLSRIEEYNDPYNCFITICDDALEVAKQRDAQLAEGNAEGLLFGVPIVIKDNMDLTGYHTTNGYKKKDSQIADSNAYVVDALLKEGAVIIAKTNMSTGAMRAEYSKSQAAGETKNAYSTYLSSGGSSGGSAVATSLNFAAASLGTDTNSSLRYPAVLNGCVALRPTFGLISKDGIKRLNSKRDVPGAITRTVMDQAIMLDVLTEGKYQYAENLNIDALKGMRIGVLKELAYRNTSLTDKEVAAAFQAAIEQLKACGAEVVEISMPNILSQSSATFGAEASKQTPFAEAFEKVLKEYDVAAAIFPTYLSTPLRSGKDENGKTWSVFSQTYISNTRVLSPSSGIPEMALPIGNHTLGAGIGMEIAAPRNSEQLLLNIAYAFTEYKDLRTLPEGAPNQYESKGTLYQVMQEHKTAVAEAEQELIRQEEECLEQERLEKERLEQEQAERKAAVQREQNRQKMQIILWIGIATFALVAVSVTIVIWATRKEKEPVA